VTRFAVSCKARDLLSTLAALPQFYEPAPEDELLELLTHARVETALDLCDSASRLAAGRTDWGTLEGHDDTSRNYAAASYALPD